MEQISIKQINDRVTGLLKQHGITLRIVNAAEQGIKPWETMEKDGVFTISVDPAQERYANWLGYEVRKLLLPRLALETPRLLLRRFRAEDAEDCFAFLSDAEDARMDCSRAFTAMDEAYRERMELFARRESQYMIVLKETAAVIGTVNVFNNDSRAVEAMEVGYCVAPAHKRKGYACEALSALLQLLQRELYLDLVLAGAREENLPSIRLLEKLGFRREGLHRKAVWDEWADQPADLVYYYRDREELTV